MNLFHSPYYLKSSLFSACVDLSHGVDYGTNSLRIFPSLHLAFPVIQFLYLQFSRCRFKGNLPNMNFFSMGLSHENLGQENRIGSSGLHVKHPFNK